MKKRNLYQYITVLLCLLLALVLTACGEKNRQPVEAGKAEKEEKPDKSEWKDHPKQTEDIILLRNRMAASDQIAGAVAYLGYRDQEELSVPLKEWLQKTCTGMVEEMPFLLEIPEERILGGSYGDLYCVVPRDENTSLAVNHIIWKTQDYGVWPEAEEVLYREEYAQPVLVFVNFEEWSDEPNTGITLVTNDGVEVNWCPFVDWNGCPVIPRGKDYIPMLMDFTYFGFDTDQGYPEEQEGKPEGDDWWFPPTDRGLADTSWSCGQWIIDMNWGDSAPEYSGTVWLYQQVDKEQEYKLMFSGVWRMEDDCLRLEIADSFGNSVGGCFPMLIDPSGDYIYMQQERETGWCPPFFNEDMTSAELIRTYG